MFTARLRVRTGRQVVTGHFAYYLVPTNGRALRPSGTMLASRHEGQQHVLAQETVHLEQKADHEVGAETEQDVVARDAHGPGRRMVGHKQLPDGDGRQENHKIDERAHGDGHHKRRAGKPRTGRLQDKGPERTHGGADQHARQGAADQAAQPAAAAIDVQYP